jgi:putative transposase
MYRVGRIKIGKSEQLDALALECGQLYSKTVACFWRTVRHKEIWLKPSSMMRWLNSDKLHAHTADACVQAFFASLKSWRARRKTDPNANPPHKLRKFFRIEYKNSAIRLRDGQLILSNGRGNAPLILDWRFDLPQTLVIHWDGKQYEAIATYKAQPQDEPRGDKVVGVDLGEVHLAVAHDGERCIILNGR